MCALHTKRLKEKEGIRQLKVGEEFKCTHTITIK
jgi:hypothetical protein